MQQFTRSQSLTNLTNAVKPRPPVPEIVKDWRPKTHAGRLTRAGYFTNYLDVRSHHIVKEPEIAEYFFGYTLSTLPLKTIPIGSGQYRFKAFVAIGDGKSFIGLGQRCAKDRSSAENGAARNAKLNLFKIRTTWIKPVTGQYNDVTVRVSHMKSSMWGQWSGRYSYSVALKAAKLKVAREGIGTSWF